MKIGENSFQEIGQVKNSLNYKIFFKKCMQMKKM